MMQKEKMFFPLNLQLFADEPGETEKEPEVEAKKEDESGDDKSFSQVDVDKAVEDALEKAKAKWQEEQEQRETEAEKLKKMNAKEKEDYQQKKREEDLSKREKRIRKKRIDGHTR